MHLVEDIRNLQCKMDEWIWHWNERDQVGKEVPPKSALPERHEAEALQARFILDEKTHTHTHTQACVMSDET